MFELITTQPCKIVYGAGGAITIIPVHLNSSKPAELNDPEFSQIENAFPEIDNSATLSKKLTPKYQNSAKSRIVECVLEALSSGKPTLGKLVFQHLAECCPDISEKYRKNVANAIPNIIRDRITWTLKQHDD